jgi:hypothetical protein
LLRGRRVIETRARARASQRRLWLFSGPRTVCRTNAFCGDRPPIAIAFGALCSSPLSRTALETMTLRSALKSGTAPRDQSVTINAIDGTTGGSI